MACSIYNQYSLFGPADKYIKFYQGDAIAVEGANTMEKQILNDLRFPYTQILRARVTLKAGQVNYLLNHLGLGDNATFLSISARYDNKSKIEEDNYLQYTYYPDISNIYYFDQMLLLTGNSTHRIPQLYLSNPNATYSVTMDVMVAVIDDTYEFFNDALNQSGSSFTGLSYSSIQTYIPNQSLVILDAENNPLSYLSIDAITSIHKSDLIITVQESTVGKVFLEFLDSYSSFQSYSLLNYIWNNAGSNPPIIIDSNHPFVDNNPPIVYFETYVGATSSGATISMVGSTSSGPYNTHIGTTFSTTISLNGFGGSYSTILKSDLIDLLITRVEDDIDGIININDSYLNVSDFNSLNVNSITSVGTYSITFSIFDNAGNGINPDKKIILNIIS